MQSIIIPKEKLLPIIESNKQKHDEIYNAAVSGYWVKAEEILQEKLVKVKAQEKIDNYLGLTYPVSYGDEYSRVISMIKLTSQESFELNQQEFDSYVRNQWNWRNSFLATNLIYCSGAVITGAAF